MRTDRCGNSCGQKCHAKGSRKETKIQGFMCRDTMKVEHELYGYTGNNWSHWNSNEKFKEYLENIQQIHNKRELYLEHHT